MSAELVFACIEYDISFGFIILASTLRENCDLSVCVGVVGVLWWTPISVREAVRDECARLQANWRQFKCLTHVGGKRRIIHELPFRSASADRSTAGEIIICSQRSPIVFDNFCTSFCARVFRCSCRPAKLKYNTINGPIFFDLFFCGRFALHSRSLLSLSLALRRTRGSLVVFRSPCRTRQSGPASSICDRSSRVRAQIGRKDKSKTRPPPSQIRVRGDNGKGISDQIRCQHMRTNPWPHAKVFDAARRWEVPARRLMDPGELNLPAPSSHMAKFFVCFVAERVYEWMCVCVWMHACERYVVWFTWNPFQSQRYPV